MCTRFNLIYLLPLILYFSTILCSLSFLGLRAFSQLPPLGISHGVRPHRGCHAASAHGLHRPPLQPDLRRLQQIVCLLPQRHDEGHLQPGGAGRAALHPWQEPQRDSLPHARPSRLPGARRHPGDDQHQLWHQHQDGVSEHWLTWVWAMIHRAYGSQSKEGEKNGSQHSSHLNLQSWNSFVPLFLLHHTQFFSLFVLIKRSLLTVSKSHQWGRDGFSILTRWQRQRDKDRNQKLESIRFFIGLDHELWG